MVVLELLGEFAWRVTGGAPHMRSCSGVGTVSSSSVSIALRNYVTVNITIF